MAAISDDQLKAETLRLIRTSLITCLVTFDPREIKNRAKLFPILINAKCEDYRTVFPNVNSDVYFPEICQNKMNYFHGSYLNTR